MPGTAWDASVLCSFAQHAVLRRPICSAPDTGGRSGLPKNDVQATWQQDAHQLPDAASVPDLGPQRGSCNNIMCTGGLAYRPGSAAP